MKRWFLRSIPVFFCFLFLFTLQSFGNKSIKELLDHMERSLKQKDIPAYLDVFSPDIRVQEQRSISFQVDQLELDNITIFRTNRFIETETSTRSYISVIFENEYEAKIEVWLLDFQVIDGQWQIRKKEIARDVRNLYKIQIPSGKEERVKEVEIKHADLTISFQNPMVFYDNIPDLETAVLVVGGGELLFTPSVARERHQLELVYKNRFLGDKINYVYLRCSNSFFAKNIRIEKGEEGDLPISQTDINRAYSLFNRHYSRSFTIENSLNGELLSSIPQGEQAVIEFEGQKIGKFTYIFSPFSEEEVTLYHWEKERFLNLYSPQDNQGERKFFISWEQKFDVKNCEVDIDFKPEDFYMSGRAKIEIETKVGTLDEVKFRMNPNLEILRINDENKNELFFTKDNLRKSLYIYFLNPIPQGRTTSFEIFYRGKIEPPKITEEVVSGAQYDRSARLVRPGNETYLYSLSSYWYPVPPEGDFYTSRFKIIIPPEYSVISTGKLVEKSKLEQIENVEDLEKVGWIAYTFESLRPVKHLSFIVGKFEKKNEISEPLPLSYYRSAETQQARYDLFDEAQRILAFYENKFGPFPFENLNIVHRVWEETGGHSPPSFVVLNQLPRVEGGRLVSAESPVNLTRWSEYFLSHELAHQWWGQGVTWDSYRDQWISEGLAQFSTLLYLREKYGESTFSNILEKISGWVRKKAKWGPIIFGSRISHFDFFAFQTIIYNKVSLVLNMLREMLGEKVFFSGIQEFFERYKYGAARTADFVNVLSEVSKQDLKPFFRDWFESYSLPEVSVSYSVQKREKGYRLKFEIIQLGDKFLFPLWLEWVEDGKKIKKMVVMDQQKKKFEFELEEKPKRIKVNPDEAVPGKFR